LDKYLHSRWGIKVGDPKREWFYESKVELTDFSNLLIPHVSKNNSLALISSGSMDWYEEDCSKVRSILANDWNGVRNNDSTL
jgi:hypothetical protein